MSGDGREAGLLFTTAKRVRTFEDIVLQIRDAVLSGRLKKGERLPNERDLAKLFGVSRSSLREGLRTLEALGMVEIRPGSAGGIFATEPDARHAGAALEAMIRFRGATAHELAEFRTSFEGETAYWAAQRASADDVADLRRIADEFARRAVDGTASWEVLADLDIEFHERLARASDNQVRLAIMLGVNRALRRASLSLEPYASESMRREIARELALIARAVERRNATLARRHMRRHVRKFSELERSLEPLATSDEPKP